MTDHADFINSQGQLIKARYEKAQNLAATGILLYPNACRPAAQAARLREEFENTPAEQLEGRPETYSLAGRIMARRDYGKSVFFDVLDSSGRIQAYLQKNKAPEAFGLFKKLDIGDLVGFSGSLFKTKTGELTVLVQHLELVTKGLLPLPEKYHDLGVELRYRQRYVDLIMNPASRRVFEIRSKVVAALRKFMESRDFIEVETPMMHPIPGGAAAKPFATHHQALDMPLYMRIAPELYLKRLLVGGFSRVFEINRSFRNEGLSPQHNPEFTMMEFYQSYSDFKELMDFTEEMLSQLKEEILGAAPLVYQGRTVKFERPWRKLTFHQALTEIAGAPAEVLTSPEAARAFLARLGGELNAKDVLGKIQAKIFDLGVEPELTDPTFITNYPADISPLARRSDDDPLLTDRFELFIAGREMANGFSELNDPLDQRGRFLAQAAEREAGDEESMYMDDDYIRALMYGMPPAAGEGIGIDRLVMLLTDSANIKDVILFPHLRPEAR